MSLFARKLLAEMTENDDTENDESEGDYVLLINLVP